MIKDQNIAGIPRWTMRLEGSVDAALANHNARRRQELAVRLGRLKRAEIEACPHVTVPG
ncbi:hypothetical protein GCM10007886_17360 [Methylobacterium gregans]|nr:hypothetical protein GCM10007886_17360 [Methylobacterium gregans]